MENKQYLQFELTVQHNPLDPSTIEKVTATVEGNKIGSICDSLRISELDIEIHINGESIPKSLWDTYELVEGDYLVVVPVMHDRNTLRIAAFIAVAVVSIYFPYAWGLEGFWGAVASATIMVAGNLIVNALLPMRLPDPEAVDSSSYGWSPHTLQREGIPLPVAYGRNKMVGNIIGTSTSVKDLSDEITINVLLSLCQGPINTVESIYINDQLYDTYRDVNTFVHLGHNYQTSTGTEFNSVEYVPGGSGIEFTIAGGAQTYTTVDNEFDMMEIDIMFPYGLYNTHKDGDLKPRTIGVKVEIRNTTTSSAWFPLTNTTLSTTTLAAGWSYGHWVGMYSGSDSEVWESLYSYVGPVTDHEYGEREPSTFTYYAPDAFWRYMEEVQTVSSSSVPFDVITLETTKTLVKTYKSGFLEPGYYQVRVTKIGDFSTYGGTPWFPSQDTGDADTNEEHNNTILSKVRLIEYGGFSYPREALVGISAIANDQLSGSLDFRAIIQGKIVRVYNGSTWSYAYSNNPAWVCYDILTQPVLTNSSTPAWIIASIKFYHNTVVGVSRYDGFDPSQIDTASFYAWAQYCDETTQDGEKRVEFNGVFDSETTVWDACMQVCTVGRANLIFDGSTIKAVIDRPSTPVALVTMGNMVQGSFNESFLSAADRAQEIEFTFIDEDNNFEKTAFSVFDEDADGTEKKSTIDLFGITNLDQAIRAAKLRINSTKYCIRSSEFDMAIDAVAFEIGDIISVQHDVPQWGYGGRVVSATSSSVTLDTPVTLVGGTYQITLRLNDDTLVTKTLTETTGTYTVVHTTTSFSSTPVAYNPWAIGLSNSVTKPFRVTGISKSGDLNVHIIGLEYNQNVYAVDDESLTIDTPTYTLPDRYPPVTSLSGFASYYYDSANIQKVKIEVYYTLPSGVYTGIKLYYKYTDSVWYETPITKTTRVTLYNVIENTDYTIVAVTVGSDGTENSRANSPSVSISTSGLTVGEYTDNDYLVNGVDNLALVGGGTTFYEPDCKIQWDPPPTVLLPTNWLKHYKIEVYDGGMSLLRTEYTTETTYTYLFSYNQQDGLNRSLTFKVYVVGNDTAETTSPAKTLSVSNPQLTYVSDLLVTTGAFQEINVSWTALSVNDVAGYDIHIAGTSGFTPSATNRIATVSPYATEFHGSITDGTYYVKVGAYDTFGRDGMVYVQYGSAVVIQPVEIDDTNLTTELADAIAAFDQDVIDEIRANIGIDNIAEFNDSTNYSVGDVFWYGTDVYRVTNTQSQPNETPPNISYYEDIGSYGGLPQTNAIAVQVLDTQVNSRGMSGILADPRFQMTTDTSDTRFFSYNGLAYIDFPSTGGPNGEQCLELTANNSSNVYIDTQLFYKCNPNDKIRVKVKYYVPSASTDVGLTVRFVQFEGDQSTVAGYTSNVLDVSVKDTWVIDEYIYEMDQPTVEYFKLRLLIPSGHTTGHTVKITECIVDALEYGDIDSLNTTVLGQAESITFLETKSTNLIDGVLADPYIELSSTWGVYWSQVGGAVFDPTSGQDGGQCILLDGDGVIKSTFATDPFRVQVGDIVRVKVLYKYTTNLYAVVQLQLQCLDAGESQVALPYDTFSPQNKGSYEWEVFEITVTNSATRYCRVKAYLPATATGEFYLQAMIVEPVKSVAYSAMATAVSNMTATIEDEFYGISATAERLDYLAASGSFQGEFFFDFNGSHTSWLTSGIALTDYPNYLHCYCAVANAYIYYEGSYLVPFYGRDYPILKIRVRRLSANTWGGYVRWKTAGHGYSSSYQHAFSTPNVDGDFHILEIDMNDSAQAADWNGNNITGICLYLMPISYSDYDIDWFTIGNYGFRYSEALVAEETSARVSAEGALAEKITTLQVTTGDNYIVDSNFDLSHAGTMTDYWSTAATISIVEGTSDAGNYVIQLTSNPGSTVTSRARDGFAENTYFSAEAGDEVFFKVNYYSTMAPTASITCLRLFHQKVDQSTGAITDEGTYDSLWVTPLTNGSWQTFEGSVTITGSDDTRYLGIGLVVRNTATSGYIQYDKVYVSKQPPSSNALQIISRVENHDAQYTVKIDNNGYVSGFGLASETIDGQVYSEFAILADRLVLIDSTGSKLVSGTISVTSNVATINTTTAHGLSVSDDIIIVGCENADINGQHIVAGVTDSDTITVAITTNDGTYSAVSTSMSITKYTIPFLATGGKVYIDSAVIGDLESDAQGSTFEPMWELNKNGALIIRDSAGNIILQSGGTLDYGYVDNGPPSNATYGASFGTSGNITGQITHDTATTYIANGAMDTLQVAGNAITLPLSSTLASDVTLTNYDTWYDIHNFGSINLYGQTSVLVHSTVFKFENSNTSATYPPYSHAQIRIIQNGVQLATSTQCIAAISYGTAGTPAVLYHVANDPVQFTPYNGAYTLKVQAKWVYHSLDMPTSCKVVQYQIFGRQWTTYPTTKLIDQMLCESNAQILGFRR